MRADPNERLFDDYAASYADVVNASITSSGETVDFFAQLKADLVAEYCRRELGGVPARVLDFGCGTGLSTRTLTTALPGAQVTGVDVSGESIDRARELDASGRAAYVHSPGATLPFAPASFDVAFAACVFHHIDRSEHVACLREIRRMLSADGVLFIFEHNPRNPLTVRAVRACPFDEGVILLDPGYTRKALRSAGFETDAPYYYFFFPNALRTLRVAEPLLRRVPLGAQYFVAARRTAD
ncbi:class I SAM-dependent methyltransferase [Roseisolibacter agri]|uniref:SAM-dependent methyltransferase n=1 Tax=Roseisolibacter agri TaxID=2014610 RepID=A0AA37V3V0_9BACT|nr:class I SAM-dependent methyltransferase [Roseisolibacter agri]GLC27162.1 SAM-dependent methyltransferase [Roseisolibacter agri]